MFSKGLKGSKGQKGKNCVRTRKYKNAYGEIEHLAKPKSNIWPLQ